MPLPTLSLSVPASTSNLGVGFDALGVALGLKMEISWTPGPRVSVHRNRDLAESTLPTGRDPVVRGMRRAARLIGQSLPTGSLEISANFPPGRGLGASGAGMVAGLILGNRLLKGKMVATELLREAIALEGHPENAVAALLGGAHWSVPLEKSDWEHLQIPLHRDLRFLLVIPPYSLDTAKSRRALPEKVPFKAAAHQARRVPALLEGLKSLDAKILKEGLTDQLHTPNRLRLLAGARPIMDTASRAGALGATLSGAGSAVLVLARTGGLRKIEQVLKNKVSRLWGQRGHVLLTRPNTKGVDFL